MNPCLADTNVLLALLVATHPQHASSTKWYRKQEAGAIGMCRFSQLGVVRPPGNRHIMASEALSARTAWDVTSELLSDERLIFCQEPPGIDDCLPKLFRYSGVYAGTPENSVSRLENVS